jgi:hypothetical protein
VNNIELWQAKHKFQNQTNRQNIRVEKQIVVFDAEESMGI